MKNLLFILISIVIGCAGLLLVANFLAYANADMDQRYVCDTYFVEEDDNLSEQQKLLEIAKLEEKSSTLESVKEVAVINMIGLLVIIGLFVLVLVLVVKKQSSK